MSIQYGGDKITFADGSTVSSGWSGFKNRIINGAMVIDQRNAGASVSIAGTSNFAVDRFSSACFTASTGATAQQSTTAPSNYINSLKITVGTGQTVGAGDVNYVLQKIEGLNIADFGWGTASASTVTLSFWVRSSVTGTFGGALQNSASNRSYPFSYTISSANTFEQKTVTITGDTSGTWLTTNGTGVQIYWSLGVGSTYSGTAGSWAGAQYLSSTGATGVVPTTGATFYITGVQLEKGSTATSFDYRPYGTEFDLCRRYYARFNVDTNKVVGTGWVINSTNGEVMVPLRPQMRSVPTFGSSTASNFNINYVACTALTLSDSGQATVDTVCVKATTAGSLTASQGSMLRSGASGQYIELSSEL